MLLLFQKFVTPEQEKMMTFIQSKGIDTSHKEDAVLKELIEYESELTSSKNPPTKREKAKPSEVRREIEENPDIAIKNNAELFDRKFEIQRRQIEAEIARAMHREGDRIITAVTGGPGDRLVDPVTFFVNSEGSSFKKVRRTFTRSGKTWWVDVSRKISL